MKDIKFRLECYNAITEANTGMRNLIVNIWLVNCLPMKLLIKLLKSLCLKIN